MSEAHKRLKQPERVRAQLLAVAGDLLVQDGPHAVTLDAVAQRAGVTKGGLQHHFRSKQALLEGLCDQLFDRFDVFFAAALEAEPEGPARHARAYLTSSFQASTPDELRTQRAIALLAFTLPSCRERWGAKMRALVAEDGADPAAADRLFLCRLAADGAWLDQLLDIYGTAPDRKDRLLSLLLRLTQGDAP
ncbi:TetR/AcrR family transcriptional regulator [Acidovorax sp. SUPP3334]|uniref:TetR/AcrR family transcriptional regulator n=1 Tax=Acidovorax sp. SUPP3334 TaxID=2920881 RepID=UPI0023DE3BBB|nr:TetR/AcrR family transcriptional regulator [Acidovorax sp. SUPP3334]GKT21606.1 TetR/AcrR family transcriptional regulator [Acidovorax sp. SUPP3334]